MVTEIKILAAILRESIDKKASDIILTSEFYPSLKIDGDIVFLKDFGIFTATQFKTLVLNLMTKVQQEKFLNNMELDFSIAFGKMRFRVNAYMGTKGYSMVFRPISGDIPDFESLGLPPIIKNFTLKTRGLVLITGGVGTGKSTTMASLINEINKKYKKHIITIEDPIEYVYENDLSLIDQREVGTSTLSFGNALKYALRQAADVILIGEMRDLETFRLALRAAETGNLVFATLHTSGSARTVNRVIDMFPASEKGQVRSQISESLIGVVWQKLIKKADGKGRVAATEIMVNTKSVSNVVRKGDTHLLDGIIETSSKDGMLTMQKSLERLFENGIISKEEYLNQFNTLGHEIK